MEQKKKSRHFITLLNTQLKISRKWYSIRKQQNENRLNNDVEADVLAFYDDNDISGYPLKLE